MRHQHLLALLWPLGALLTGCGLANSQGLPHLLYEETAALCSSCKAREAMCDPDACVPLVELEACPAAELLTLAQDPDGPLLGPGRGQARSLQVLGPDPACSGDLLVVLDVVILDELGTTSFDTDFVRSAELIDRSTDIVVTDEAGERAQARAWITEDLVGLHQAPEGNLLLVSIDLCFAAEPQGDVAVQVKDTRDRFSNPICVTP